MRVNFYLKFLILILSFSISALPAYATTTKIHTVGTIPSFGTYSFKGSLSFNIPNPGKYEIGKITVFGTYNKPYPWVMRVYTDNTNYAGIGGNLETQSRAGLISTDGKFTIPLEVNCPNFGEDVWVRIPDINDESYEPYKPSREAGMSTHSDCIIMGIDPRNADWVSGRDRVLFTNDDNPAGDTTLAPPFDIKFAAYFDQKAIRGNYTSNLYIEIVPAP